MKRPLTYLCALLLGASVLCVSGEDAAPVASTKDPVCKLAEKTGVDCHTNPGSRASVLKSYLAKQEQLASAPGGTNGAKVCDQPMSKAALLQKKAPTTK